MARAAPCGADPRCSELEKEAGMGLRWTFMPVYWSTMEPEGPVDLSREIPPGWQALDPFVIEAREVKVLSRSDAVFRYQDGTEPKAGPVWIAWADADTGDAQVKVPVHSDRVRLVQVDGSETVTNVPGHRLILELKGDRKMAPPVIVVDRAAS